MRGMRGLSARMAVASAGLAAVLIAVLVVLVLAIDRQREAARAAQASERTRGAISALQLSLLDVETGLRGYFITGQDRFLAPFRRGRASFPARAQALEEGVAGDPRQERLAREIREGMTDYLKSYAEPLLLSRRSGAEALEAVGTDAGRRRTDRLRVLFSRMAVAQARLAAERRERADDQASLATAVGLAGLFLTLIIVGLVTFYLSKVVTAPVRRVSSAARGLAAGDLSSRVAPGDGDGGGEVGDLARAFNAMADSLQDQQGRLEHRRGELSRAVFRLESEKARIARYGAFGRRIATQSEADELGRTIVTEVAEITGADAAVLYAAEEEQWPVPLATHPPDGPAPAMHGHGPAGRALAEGETIALDGDDPQRLLGLPAGELLVPLVHGGATVGLVALGWQDPPTLPGAAEQALADLVPPAAATLSNLLALRSTRRRASVIRAVLDSTPDAIALLDPDGRTVLENLPMRTLRRAQAEDVRAVEEVGRGGDGRGLAGGAVGDGEQRDELELPGTGRTFARYAAPVRDDAGVPVGRLVVLREVTGEREAERLKDEFFALVSHELRTPLTSVIGYLELVLDDEEPLAADHRHYLEVVQRNATRLLRLVGDLLFVAQVEAGTLSLAPGAVDLPAVAAEAVEAARPRAEGRDIELRADIEPVPPTWGDSDRLGQVLDNLVANALKFTPSGGQVAVRLARENGQAVLRVADSGGGIDPSEQHRVFERFFRAESSVAAAVPGVGLGLTIVKAIAEAHDGHVSVESRPGGGTTFTVELPLRAPGGSAQEEPESSAPPAARTPTPGAGGR